MLVRFIPSSDLSNRFPLAHRLTPAGLVTRYAANLLAPELAEALTQVATDLLGPDPEVLAQPAPEPARWVVVDRQLNASQLLTYDLGPTYLLLQPRADLLTRAMAAALERTGTQLAHHFRRL